MREIDPHPLTYWKQQLAGAPTLLDLPTDRPRPSFESFDGAAVGLKLSYELTGKLRALAQGENATLPMLLVAAFQVLMSRLSGQSDVVVGLLVANQGHAPNTLPLRTDLSADPSFLEALRFTREATLAAHAHQDVPFDRLVEELLPGHHPSHAPLVQVFFLLHRGPSNAPPSARQSPLRPASATGNPKGDLCLALLESDEGISGALEYNARLFDTATIERMIERYQVLLDAALTNPSTPVSRLPLLSVAEREQVVRQFNATADEGQAVCCIHELLEQQAHSQPQAIALIFDEQRICYRDLNESANRIAHHLLALGGGPGTLIAIYSERTPDMVAAILGILKCGAAYVPLDPRYPAERLRAILEDAAAPIVLTQHSLIAQLQGLDATMICLDSDRAEIQARSCANPASAVSAQDLAFVLFTSGSTGRPKGVALEHRNAVNFVRWTTQLLCPADLAGVLFCTSICFDMSTFEMFVTIAAGGSMILTDGPLDLASLRARDQVTLINTVPSAMQELTRLKALPRSLRVVVLAGEALPASLAQDIHAAGVQRLFNMYGPTETGYTTSTLVAPHELITIGKPIANAQAYVLDRHHQPQPIGVPGEIYLAGAGTARGYHGRADLTAERFVPNPFDAAYRRMYRTGDLGRWLPDGNLQYLGRLDQQVKLRGFRIELGEIEAALERHPGVQQTLVMAREDRPGIKQLVGYIIADGAPAPTAEQLLSHLRQQLPEFMLPSAILVLEAFPLTPNGKIDRKALPAPESVREPGQTYVPPRTAQEQAIADVWRQLLHIDEVGVLDNFFALGGHSLLAAQVISHIRQTLHVDLPLRAIFESPTVAELAARVGSLPLTTLHWEIARAERRRLMPPSFSQQRMWFLDQLEPGTSTYNIPWTLRLTGALNREVLGRSFDALLHRHETLRTSFAADDGRPWQIIHDGVPFEVSYLDLSSVPCEQRDSEAQARISIEARRPFRLDEPPLVRAALIRIEDQQHMLLISIHHIISDRWSMGVFAQELAHLYDALADEQLPRLPELTVQYADFAVWQRERLNGTLLEQQLSYWRQHLKDAPAILDLPTDRPRPKLETFNGDIARLKLSQQLTAKLNSLAQAENATLFMVLLAAFQVLMSRLSGQSDVVIGIPIASRSHAQIEGLIGLFTNTLPLRADLSCDPTFRQALLSTREAALGAYAHQDMPFEKLVEELRPERNLSHSPLVQVYFILQNAPVEALHLRGLQLAHVESMTKTSKGELFFSLFEAADGLRGAVEYNTDLFDAATIERLLEHYRVLLESVVADASLPVSRLPLLGPQEQQHLLVDFNATVRDYPRDLCVHELIEQQVERSPQAIACQFQDTALTYEQLNGRANQLAHWLRRHEIGPGRRVALFVERSLEMLVALLAIQKSGAAYVPLDPAYPPDRIRMILEDAQVSALISEHALLPSIADCPALVLSLDSDWTQVAAEARTNPEPWARPADLLYVIFTSGSTGRPKGVQIEHGSVVNFLASMRHEPGLAESDTLLAVTTLSFDIAGLELYLPLICGARVVLTSREEAADGNRLLALLESSGASVMQATPATWRMLIDCGWSGTRGLKALCGGEALTGDLAGRVRDRCDQLWNLYGPTETTIWSALQRVESSHEGVVPIGRPIANTSVYVLDRALQPVPIGVTGELYIAGDGVARGYLERSELTAEKFRSDPFRPAQRMYRTGDLARFRPDGCIEFIGRADFQVKLRGHRIELGEIESVLSKHPGISQCVVLLREDHVGDKRLVGYLVAETGHGIQEWRAWAREQLPEYMVPATCVQLDALPLTPNGKIDRKALPVPDYAQSGPELDGSPLRTPIEEVIADIWGDVLGLERIGRHDQFFDLGGHSLSATQVVSRIRQAFSVELPLRAMFEWPTVAELAEQVQELRRTQRGSTIPPMLRISRDGPLPLSFAQQRLWFLDQLEPNNPLYNVSHITRMQGALNIAALERALNDIVGRHESLRTNFRVLDGEPVQVIASSLQVALPIADLRSLPAAEREEGARQLATQELQRPFDLSAEPLMRALLIRLDDEDHALVINTHHIISDRWSLGVLSRELAALYEARLLELPHSLPELDLQYGDYAVWQRQMLTGPLLEQQIDYWKRQLAGAPSVLELPTDRPRRASETFWGAVHRHVFSPELVGSLRALSRRHQATLFMTLIAAFEAVLARVTGQRDILVGTDLANRTQIETEKLIGFFVNLLPIRATVDERHCFRELLLQMRQTCLGAFSHQDVPFERIVEEVRPERVASHNPLVQVLFVMQNTPQGAREFGGLKLSPLGVSGSSRFDLVLFINEPEQAPFASWVYNPNLFDASTIRRFAALYDALLAIVAANSELPLEAVAQRLSELEQRLRTEDHEQFQQASARRLKGLRRGARPSTPT